MKTQTHQLGGIHQNFIEINGRMLYMDCADASVETMISAIELVSNTEMPSPEGHRIAVLGMIAGLDQSNLQGYTAIGQAILQSGIDILICHGHDAANIATAASAKPGLKIIKTMELIQLAEAIQKASNPGDLILVKASRNAYLERAVDTALGTFFTLEIDNAIDRVPVLKIQDFNAKFFRTHTIITQYIGNDADVVIPPAFSAQIMYIDAGKRAMYGVFGIAANAFSGNDIIKNVNISNGVKFIGQQAFANCSKLTHIYIPPSVVNIEAGAFEGSQVQINGQPGSFAASYAKKYGLPFEAYESKSMIEFETAILSGEASTIGYLRLINTNHPITAIPKADAFISADHYVPVKTKGKVFASKFVLLAANQMLKAAKDDGIDTLYVEAGFSPDNKKTDEHITGSALDILAHNMARDEFSGSPQHEWLVNNAYRFGFILRYPKGKENITGMSYKPWHFRYVGRVHACYMQQNNMVLEEYLKLLKASGDLVVDIYGASFHLFYKMPKRNQLQVPVGITYDISADNCGGFIITADIHALVQKPIPKVRKMLTISRPEVIRNEDHSSLTAKISIGTKEETIFLKVDTAYEQYLNPERADGFLIGLLQFAMRFDYDITCEAPVSVELLYNLENHLIPTLCKSTDAQFNDIKIHCTTINTPIQNADGIGTGMSLGVDSMHALANHMPGSSSPYTLTHLLFGNFGNFEGNYRNWSGQGVGVEKVQNFLYEGAKKVASEANLPLIFSDSNISAFYHGHGIPFMYVHSYFMAFTIHSMSKLFKTYFFSSTYTYNQFHFSEKDPASHDLLTLNMFSIKSLRFNSEGPTSDRMEKTERISNFDLAQKHLNVCIGEEHNCGVCDKCRRTMISLDLLGKLDCFAAVFPIQKYRENTDAYLMWLATQMHQNKIIERPIWEAMLKSHYGARFKRMIDSLAARSSRKPDDNIITIGQPQLIRIENLTRLVSTITVGDKKHDIWVAVDSEYEDCLVIERSDAFLIGMITYAMHRGYDIFCTAPVSEELLYNLKTHLVPALCNNLKVRLYNPNIFARTTKAPLENKGGVGTGMSLGVDSMHALAMHMPDANNPFALTHLVFSNLGNFEGNYTNVLGKDKAPDPERIKDFLYTRAKKVAESANLPMVFMDTNLTMFYHTEGILFTHLFTFYMAFSVHAIAKLFEKYLYSSSFTYHQFDVNNLGTKEVTTYDLLTLNSCSTQNLRFFSEGAPKDRMEKLKAILDFEPAKQFLNVCVFQEENCGVCNKCRRTIMCLDLMGKLNDFSNIFPVDAYRDNFDNYLQWLAGRMHQNSGLDQPIWEAILKGPHADRFRQIANIK